MALKQCANGHIYDDSNNASCPYCSGQSDLGETISLGAAPAAGNSPTKPFNATQALGAIPTVALPKNMGVTEAPIGGPKDQRKTEYLDSSKNSEIKPVRGWLVVIEGEKNGMDFRLHNAKNTIGRSKRNDVCFDFDKAVSEYDNASIVYDERNIQFYIVPGESGTNNVYINATEPLLAARPLKEFDIIEIGQTKLVFRSLCNADFVY